MKKKSILYIILLGILGVSLLRSGFRVAGRIAVSDLMLDGFDTTEGFFADIDRQRAFEAEWEVYRKEERANGGPTYLPEDMFAPTRKIAHWKEYFVLTYVPEGFYYKDSGLEGKSPGDYILTEIFYDFPTETQFVYFVQSADYDYNKGHLPNGIKKEEGKLYKEEKGKRNQVIWFHGDLTLYLEGNIPLKELEKMALQAVNYDQLQYDYGAIEDAVAE